MKEVTDKNFNDLVLKSTKPVVVDFWAPWCGPCRMVSPILEELSDEYSDVEILSCNVDDNPLSAQKFGIRNIPTVMFFNEGVHKDTQIGAGSKQLFESKIKNFG